MKAEYTPRELQVLKLMAESKHNKEIAVLLGITEHTAKFHVNSVIVKTKQNTRLGAVIYCLKQGVLSLHDLMPQVTMQFQTATAMTIIEENKVAMQEQKNNMIENLTNDIIEELYGNYETIVVTDSKTETAAKIKTVFKTYFPDNQ